MACPTDTLPDGPLSEGPLAPGASRSHDYTVTCTDEDAPGGTLFVEASVSGPSDPVPGTPGNETDRQDTTLV